MFCSTIIPTVGRPTLNRAVQSVLEQAFFDDAFELIVVNDSGVPLEEQAWHHSEKVTILNTQRRERCMARNSGAAIAKGRYLHFLDDDDWMVSGFLASFYQLVEQEQVSETAVWLYGATQLVDRDDQPIIELHHGLSGNCFAQIMAGEWIPLQSSLINAKAFFAEGGFDPMIPGSEDIDLLRRIAFKGSLAEVQDVVCCLQMGLAGSTTDYNNSALKARATRDAILNRTGVFKRLKASASSAMLNGRILRLYLTSAYWNLQQRRILTAVSRSLHALAALLTSGSAIFNSAYWQAITTNYDSPTFLNGFKAANRSVERRVLDI